MGGRAAAGAALNSAAAWDFREQVHAPCLLLVAISIPPLTWAPLLPQPSSPAALLPALLLQVEAFSETLAEHQKARLPDGSTVLERSVMEHNLEAASKLYSNIYVGELGALLGVAPEQAEAIASRMALEKRLLVRLSESEEGERAGRCGRWDGLGWLLPVRMAPAALSSSFSDITLCSIFSPLASPTALQADIDQVEGLITFKAAPEPLVQWDRNIAGLCGQVNALMDVAAAKGMLGS